MAPEIEVLAAALREARGDLTGRAFARAIGVGTATMARWLSGRMVPDHLPPELAHLEPLRLAARAVSGRGQRGRPSGGEP